MSKAILYSGNKLCHSKFLLRVSFVRKQLSSWRRVCKKKNELNATHPQSYSFMRGRLDGASAA